MGIEGGMNEGELGFLGNALVGRERVRMAGCTVSGEISTTFRWFSPDGSSMPPPEGASGSTIPPEPRRPP